MGAMEGQVSAQEGGLETQANESSHAEEVVGDDEGTVGTEEKVPRIGSRSYWL
jgi:hypothetical protein